jgi:hypothetical protein
MGAVYKNVKYRAIVNQDVMVHCKGYSGMLSNVNLMGAEHLLNSKARMIELNPKDSASDNNSVILSQPKDDEEQ